MIYAEIIEFLAKVPPFQFLDREALEGLVSKIAVEFFPKGTTILKQGGAPSKHLSVIRKGSVKVVIMSSGAEEVVSDYRGEGDSFGFLSLASGDKSRAGVVAIEDTICYQIDRATVMRLMDTHPAFTEFFLKSFLNKFIDRTYEEMQSRRLMYGGGDKLLFTTKVGDIVRREAVTAPAEITIREAAALMSEHRISSLVITDEMGVPVGFMSVRDFRDKVINRGRDVESPVSSIMSATLIKVEAEEFCFEALLKMIHYGIHHLIVVENGGLRGVVTNHDMMMLQGSSPVAVAREIENQQDMDGLAGAVRKVGELVVLLLKDGARASNITGIITEINDRVLKKVLTLAERKFGPPPVPYCWIVYGSEGRREQTFKTDQDNGLIYADAADPEQARQAAEYFGKFAAYVNDSLVSIGFARCPGNYMASNPEWCQPFSVWKKYFATWIQTPTPEAILASVILFDFRPVYGDMLLGTKLREFVTVEARRTTMFLKHMADLTVQVKPPLGFFKTFVVDKNGEHKDEMNLKFKCIAPLINIVRLYALEQGVAETSTNARLKALAKAGGQASEFAEELGQAFEFASLLRIHHQHAQMEAGHEPDNFINPDSLGNLEKKTLKESCRLISRAQDAIQKQYSPGMTL